MTNDQMFYFKDVDAIIGKKFKYIMMSTKLEMQRCDGREVVVMKVMMGGFDENNRPVFMISGCPCPPCKPAVNAELDRLFL